MVVLCAYINLFDKMLCSLVCSFGAAKTPSKRAGEEVEEGLLDASDDSQPLHGATGTPTVGEK